MATLGFTYNAATVTRSAQTSASSEWRWNSFHERKNLTYTTLQKKASAWVMSGTIEETGGMLKPSVFGDPAIDDYPAAFVAEADFYYTGKNPGGYYQGFTYLGMSSPLPDSWSDFLGLPITWSFMAVIRVVKGTAPDLSETGMTINIDVGDVLANSIILAQKLFFRASNTQAVVAAQVAGVLKATSYLKWKVHINFLYESTYGSDLLFDFVHNDTLQLTVPTITPVAHSRAIASPSLAASDDDCEIAQLLDVWHADIMALG